MAQPLHGPRVALVVGRLLPPGLADALRDGPSEAAVASLDRASETPERIWSRAMAVAVAEQLEHLTAAARTAQVRLSVGAAAGAGRVPAYASPVVRGSARDSRRCMPAA
jgi:hypothetical protein